MDHQIQNGLIHGRLKRDLDGGLVVAFTFSATIHGNLFRENAATKLAL